VKKISSHNLALVCWSWVRRGYTNAKWRFPIRDFAFIMPIGGSVDPAYRWLSRSQQTTDNCDQVAWAPVFYGPQLAASRRAVYKACSARKFASTGMQWVSGPYGLALPGTALLRLLASWSSPGLLHGRGRTLFARPIPHEELHLLGAQVGPARDAYPKTPITSQTHLLEFPARERHQ
jgi:hypothetical protein